MTDLTTVISENGVEEREKIRDKVEGKERRGYVYLLSNRIYFHFIGMHQ
jgi:hypothetical protein